MVALGTLGEPRRRIVRGERDAFCQTVREVGVRDERASECKSIAYERPTPAFNTSSAPSPIRRERRTPEVRCRNVEVDVDADTPLLWVLRDEVGLRKRRDMGCREPRLLPVHRS